jgi:glutathione S-transferase
MIEVWQAEWCPFSARVRLLLTERGVDFVARQVGPEPPREAMRERVGADTIPAVRLDDGEVLAGDTDEILAALEERFPPTTATAGHEAQAARH